MSWWNPISWGQAAVNDAGSITASIKNWVINEVTNAANLLANDIVDAVNWASQIGTDLYNWADAAFNVVEAGISYVTGLIQSTYNWAVTSLEALYNTLAADISSAYNTLATSIGNLYHAVESDIVTAYDTAIGAVDSVYNSLITDLTNAYNTLLGDAENLYNKAIAFANQVLNTAEQWTVSWVISLVGNDVVTLLNGIRQAWKWIEYLGTIVFEAPVDIVEDLINDAGQRTFPALQATATGLWQQLESELGDILGIR